MAGREKTSTVEFKGWTVMGGAGEGVRAWAL